MRVDFLFFSFWNYLLIIYYLFHVHTSLRYLCLFGKAWNFYARLLRESRIEKSLEVMFDLKEESEKKKGMKESRKIRDELWKVEVMKIESIPRWYLLRKCYSAWWMISRCIPGNLLAFFDNSWHRVKSFNHFESCESFFGR